MSTLEITNSSIYIPHNKTGLYIRDIDLEQLNDITYLTEKQPDFNKNNIIWSEGQLYAWDITYKKTFNVFIYKLTESTALLKPKEKYCCSCFENIFGFDFECSNFDPNKIIYLYTRI